MLTAATPEPPESLRIDATNALFVSKQSNGFHEEEVADGRLQERAG